MTTGRRPPTDPLAFIQRCVRERKVYWTYHVNIRLAGRYISRDELFEATETYEIVESYPEDKYLPSYLVWATSGAGPFHVLFAADVDRDNVRIVTGYRPNADEWESDLKSRKGPR